MNQEKYLKKIKRMSGMSEKRKAHVNSKLLEVDDWRINCKSCNKVITGSLNDLDAHRSSCGDEESN